MSIPATHTHTHTHTHTYTYTHVQYLLQCLAIVVTAVISNAWLLLAAVLLFAALVCLQQYYLRTSRDIKRLEAIGSFVHQYQSLSFSSPIPVPIFSASQCTVLMVTSNVQPPCLCMYI